MRIAIYARKSVYSDKSDSVSNQIRMCREYMALRHDEVLEFEEYQDEGFTGANTDRPGLNALLDTVKNKNVNAVVIYQLDRLSRNVRDFSNIYALFEDSGIEFVSVKENIDTSTPIGRAMTMITMVFAQMEREQIASRVTDNMRGLAIKGFWAMGTVPIGYERLYVVVDGKKHSTLKIESEGEAFIKGLYDDFLDRHWTVQHMETMYKRQGKRTRQGMFLDQSILYRLISNPVYCQATKEVYDYYKELGCNLSSTNPADWNGERGVMVYGRRGTKNRTKRPKEEWMVCVGLHPWIIPADRWLKAQERFKENRFDRQMKYDVPLLKGIVRCKCGKPLSVARKKRPDGTVLSEYYCLKRARQGKDVCDAKMVVCEKLDREVHEVFQKIVADPDLMKKYAAKLNSDEGSATDDLKRLETEIISTQKKISKLTASLAAFGDSPAAKHVVEEIKRLDGDLSALKREEGIVRAELRKDDLRRQEMGDNRKVIGELMDEFDDLPSKKRNEIAKKVIKKCVWDGKELVLGL